MTTSIALLQRLISFPTVSASSITDLVSELAQRGEDIGATVLRFETSADKHNLVLQLGEHSDNSLALSGHMDVVPVTGQRWDTDPFQGTIIDDKIYGRGACDMKGFIATVFSLLSRPEFRSRKWCKGLTLAFTHDEEIGCLGAQALEKQLQAIDFPLPKAMLIGEPTSLDIFHHHGGHSTITLSILGKSAHSSKPHLGINANEWLFLCMEQIMQWQDWLKQQICPVSQSIPILNLAQINSGSAINIIAEHAVLKMGLRPMPSHDIHTLLDPLREKIAPLQQKIERKGGQITLELTQHTHPLHTNVPCALSQAIKKEHPPAKTMGALFATDGGQFAQMGCSPLIWGPGSIDIAHQPNEFIEVQELLSYEKQLGSLLQKWCFER